jgi:predicted nucleic acid-binding protein
MIYVDSCVLIYGIEQHPRFGKLAAGMLAQAGDRDAPLAISSLVKFECLVMPLRQGNIALQRRYEDVLAQLVLLPMSDAVFLLGAELRARFNLKSPDALHLACALHHRCEELWTHDDRLLRASHGLARNLMPVAS